MRARERGPASGLTFDAGGLIAVDRGDERVRALLRVARMAGLGVAVPAAALAQVWRDGRRQARLAAFLRVRDGAPELVPLDGALARAAGELCGRSDTSDIVDASVVLAARLRRDRIVTSDPADLARLDPTAPLVTV